MQGIFTAEGAQIVPFPPRGTGTAAFARHFMAAPRRVRAENDDIDFGSMCMSHAMESAEQKLADAMAVIVHAEPPPYDDDGRAVTDLSDVYPPEIFEAMAHRAHTDPRFAGMLLRAIRSGLVPKAVSPLDHRYLPIATGLARVARRVMMKAADRHLMTRTPDLGYAFAARDFATGPSLDDRTTVREMIARPVLHGRCHITMPDGGETVTREFRSPSWLDIARAMPRGDGTRTIRGLRALPTLDCGLWFETVIAA